MPAATATRNKPPPGGLFASVDDFIDALWLEEGLSRNTLAAYRRDLTLYARWLQARGGSLETTARHDLQAYFAARHSATKASTANRRLTVFKRYFRWCLREGRITEDPTLQLEPAKRAPRMPRTVAQAEVEAGLAGADGAPWPQPADAFRDVQDTGAGQWT